MSEANTQAAVAILGYLVDKG